MGKGMPRRGKVLLLVLALLIVALRLVVAVRLSGSSAALAMRATEAERQLKQALQEIAASGAPVKLVQLAKPPVPKVENAALVYEKAFAEMATLSWEGKALIAEMVRGKLDLADPTVAKQAQAVLSKARKALRLLHQASAMPRCDFRLDWSKGTELGFPHFAKLRACSRLLSFESMMLLHEGRVDRALAACADNFRLTKAADEPILIAALVQYSLVGNGSKYLERVLRESQPSASACRSVAKDIAGMDLRASYVAALQGERAFGISEFDKRASSCAVPDRSAESDAEEQGPSLERGECSTYSQLASQELAYLQLMEGVIKEAALPYRELADIRPSAGESTESVPAQPMRVSTESITPNFARAQMSRDKAIANLGLAETALLLKAYRAKHGSYPEWLDELTSITEGALPADPFSGKPFVYRREGTGFLVYSWGPNLKDDGGTVGQRPDEGDIVFQCLR